MLLIQYFPEVKKIHVNTPLIKIRSVCEGDHLIHSTLHDGIFLRKGGNSSAKGALKVESDL